MYTIETSQFLQLSPLMQGKFLSIFMYNLTIGVRSIYLEDKKNIKQQLYGINNIYHMIIPFMNSLVFESRNSYTIEIIVQNLQDMSLSYDIAAPIKAAWEQAQASILL